MTDAELDKKLEHLTQRIKQHEKIHAEIGAALKEATGHLQREQGEIVDIKKALVALSEATTSLTGAAANLVLALAEAQRASNQPHSPMLSVRVTQVQGAVNTAVTKVRTVVEFLGGKVE
jgi:septal ring factor EnvC (AmiA/AmiB activator)